MLVASRRSVTELVTSAADLRRTPAQRARRRSASSASATRGCRSRWRSPRPGSRSPASTWTSRTRAARCRSAAPTSWTFRSSATASVDGRLKRDDRLRRGGRARRAHDLRPDAALEDAHARPLLHRLGRRVRGRAPAPRPARRPAVDDVSGHDRGDRPADPRARRAARVGRTSSSATRPSASTRATTLHDQEHAEADRGRDRRVPPAHRAPVQRDRRHDRPVLVDARRRDRPRSTRTPSARSTSRWPTSWRSCATSSASPPGR